MRNENSALFSLGMARQITEHLSAIEALSDCSTRIGDIATLQALAVEIDLLRHFIVDADRLDHARCLSLKINYAIDVNRSAAAGPQVRGPMPLLCERVDPA